MSARPRSNSRFHLYEWCVQSPELQARFLRALHRGAPSALAEDFCGPASIARAWAILGQAHTAFGVDRDPEPLRHARLRAREQGLGSARFRATRADVLTAPPRNKADIIAAFNFAVCELQRRRDLLAYLRRVRARLKPRGIFACDVYGGPGAFVIGKTTVRRATPAGRVEYTWEQRHTDPLTGRVENAMHFRIGAGRTQHDAFVYHWRLWSVPELRDAIDEAGFISSEIHLSYGGAIDGEGNPVPEPANITENPLGDFVAYIIARR